MDTCVQVLHIQYDSKQSVHLLLRHILQVCHMVTWPETQKNERSRTNDVAESKKLLIIKVLILNIK